MVAVRALQRRMLKLEKASNPRPSPFSVWFGSIDVLVDTFIIPGIQNRLFDGREMADLVGAIRSWEDDGHYLEWN